MARRGHGRLCPAWDRPDAERRRCFAGDEPADERARVSRLRAKGAFVVSDAIRGGHVTAQLTSEKGSGAAVTGGWTKPAVQEIDGNGAVVGPVSFTNTGGLVKFATTIGHTYRISEAP
jgi:hypothetical protein